MTTARAKIIWRIKHIPPILFEEQRQTYNAYMPLIEFDDHKREPNEASWNSVIFNDQISGCESISTVRYLFDNAPYERFKVGATFKLYEGPRMVAEGVITEIFDS